MTKIACLDVDMTLVDNKTSAYNEKLINELIQNQFDEVYLVTGRNANDFWQHVLQQGKPHPEWQNQLLFKLKVYLQSRGIAVTGISTPFDHYLMKTKPDAFGGIRQSGDAAEQFYLPFEQKMVELAQTREITKDLLIDCCDYPLDWCDYTDKSKPKPLYPNGLEGFEGLSIAMNTYLAVNNDTDKKNQFHCLLDRVLNADKRRDDNNDPANIELTFWDDKPENLATVRGVCEQRGIKCITTILVERVSDNQLTSLEDLKTLMSTLNRHLNTVDEELHRLSQKYGASHPAVTQLSGYLTQLRSVHASGTKILETSANNCRIAIKDVATQMESTANQMAADDLFKKHRGFGRLPRPLRATVGTTISLILLIASLIDKIRDKSSRPSTTILKQNFSPFFAKTETTTTRHLQQCSQNITSCVNSVKNH